MRHDRRGEKYSRVQDEARERRSEKRRRSAHLYIVTPVDERADAVPDS
jgi:hypothetical protein